MDYEINKSKFVTLYGDIQSGKTNEEINYCLESISVHKLPVIFIVRNITADQLQLRSRFDEYNKRNNTNINVILLSDISKENCVKFLDSIGVVILLCNYHQLLKMKVIIRKYQGDYNLCIDEVDFALKSKDKSTEIDPILYLLKQAANHILGATATPFALFSGETLLTKIKKIQSPPNYCGIDSLNVNFVNPKIDSTNPASDEESINKIYTNLTKKDHSVILHLVSKEIYFHGELRNYLSEQFPYFTILTYNGNGIKVVCKGRGSLRPMIKKNKNYKIENHYTHNFNNFAISEVLQILKDDPDHQHTHISIISGHLASRGISFVSSDYKLHLTDQYFSHAGSSHGENILQSLRILGCYSDNDPLTLWCGEHTWNAICDQYEIMYKFIKIINNSPNWLSELQSINIPRPLVKMTRDKLTKGTKFNSNKNFVHLQIQYQEYIPPDPVDPEPEQEINLK